MRYRRSTTSGATYFFTLVLRNRKSDLLTKHIDNLRFAFKKVQTKHPFKIDAIVILPDHLHFIMTLPTNDSNFSNRLSLIKASFSIRIKKRETISVSRKKKRERGIWQRRFWEHMIRNDKDYEQHINYIHYNPVKHCYVSHPDKWPYSSIHRHIRLGLIPKHWSREIKMNEKNFGE